MPCKSIKRCLCMMMSILCDVRDGNMHLPLHCYEAALPTFIHVREHCIMHRWIMIHASPDVQSLNGKQHYWGGERSTWKAKGSSTCVDTKYSLSEEDDSGASSFLKNCQTCS